MYNILSNNINFLEASIPKTHLLPSPLLFDPEGGSVMLKGNGFF